MSHKITILDVEHVVHAGRIIVRYNLCCNTSNLNSPGWRYIDEGTAYRGVCDDEWICMTPNIAHPLHSNEIRTSGVYFFVWDYHGVQGLDLSSFTSQTNFLVQLALQDSGCDFTDPCDPPPCLTPDGNPVVGDLGTEGNCGPGYRVVSTVDGCLCCELCYPCLLPENINHVPGGCATAGDPVEGPVGSQGNCCDNYFIRLDANGCPECVEDIENDGIAVDNGPPAGGISPGQPNPPGGGGSEPGGPADGIGGDPRNDHFGGGDGGGGESNGINWFTDPLKGFGTTENDLNVFRGEDSPVNQTTIDAGPGVNYLTGPNNRVVSVDSPGGGYAGSPVSGDLLSQFQFLRPDDEGGDGTYQSSLLPMTRTNRILVKGAHGGKNADVRNFQNYKPSQIYNKSINKLMGPDSPVPSTKEFHITTRHFVTSNGPILNSVPGKSGPLRGQTVPTDAIFVKDGTAFVQFKQEFRKLQGVIRRDTNNGMSRTAVSSTNSLAKETDVRGARKNISQYAGAKTRQVGTDKRRRGVTSSGSSSGIGERSPARAKSSRSNTDTVKNMDMFVRSSEFSNMNRADLNIVPSRGVSVGGSIHCNAISVPRVAGSQVYSMAVYIRDSSGKVIEVASSPLRSSLSKRQITTTVGTSNLSPGTAYVMMLIFDVNNKPLHRSVRKIELYDAGSIQGVPDATAKGSGAAGRPNDAIGQLVKSTNNNKPIRINLGSTESTKSINVLLKRTKFSEKEGTVVISALTKHVQGPIKHHVLTAWEQRTFQRLYQATTERRILPNAYQGTRLAISPSNLEDATANINGDRYTSYLHKVIGKGILINPDIIINISTAGNLDKNSSVDLFVGGDYSIPESELVSHTVSPVVGKFDLECRMPYVSTRIAAFKTGGNNHIPEDPEFVFEQTNFTGDQTFRVTAERGDWIGLALVDAPGALSSRTFFYFQIPY